MTVPRTYSTARAFRIALEARLQQIAVEEKTDIQRLRRQVAFDRLLARLYGTHARPWVLKGGYALELRMHQARSTKDIDLTVESPKSFDHEQGTINERVRAALQAQVADDPGDSFVFLIGEVMMDIDAAPYGGARYPIDARMDGRTFAKFHLDVGIGDVILAPLETLETRDWLGFAGIKPPTLSLLSREQQFAEKLHAYTLPNRQTPNSRVKDLVDMAMLIDRGNMDKRRVKESIQATFDQRKTHTPAEKLEPPPDSWRPVFERLAAECGCSTDMDTAFGTLSNFVRSL